MGNDFAYRRLGHDSHHGNGDQNDGSQNGGNLIHDGLCIFVYEDQNAKAAGNDSAHTLVQAEHGVHAQGYAANVADVKGQTANGHQNGNHIAKAGQHLVGNILCAHTRNAYHRPDIHLGNDIHADHQQDHADQVAAVGGGELGGLCQKSGADSRGGHQEGCAEHDRTTRLGGGGRAVTHKTRLLFCGAAGAAGYYRPKAGNSKNPLLVRTMVQITRSRSGAPG